MTLAPDDRLDAREGITRGRIVWIDAARGICVLGVVLMHATLSLGFGVIDSAAGVFWRWLIDVMGPFRMPGLSMLSGLLLARRIRHGWADRSVRVSIATSYWLYAVWLLLFVLFAVVVGSAIWTGPIGGGTDAQAWQALLNQLVLPRTLLWYVLALAVWTALLTTLRRVDPALVLVGLTILSIAAAYLPVVDNNDQYRNIARYALFFAIGVYGSAWIRGRVAQRPGATAAQAAGVAAVCAIIMVLGDNPDVAAVLSAPRDAAAALLLLTAVAIACRVGPVGRALAWIGRRTLPVYVMHGLLLEALLLSPLRNQLLGLPLVGALSPLIVTLAVAAVAVGVHALVIRTPLRVVFALPAPWRRRLAGGTE